mmetsp:Transcript_2996/g.4552  ORF Transcript_2996/g.4552 Transcript_2996/m.4552 type:complete len:1659 (+) Transcript_2996:117-5093(+)
MKFILQLVINVAMSFMSAITKFIAGYKHGENDIYFFICGILLLISLFYPWVLILAFLALLPSFHEQLSFNPELVKSAHSSMEERDGLQPDEDETPDSHPATTTVYLPCDVVDDPSTSSSHQPTPNDTPKASPSRPKPKKIRKMRPAKEEWGMPTLRVLDQSGKIIPVNSEKPVPIESEYFKGCILIMVKCDGDLSEYNRHANHFQGKQRKFEVQFQGQMKFLPKGEVMLGGELFDKMQISFVTRSLLSFLMKFAMSLNPFLHFGFGEEHRKDGMFEYPHLTFPLFRVMDRVVVTPPGGELPTLGKELPEVDADRIARRSGKGPHMTFQQDHTYSFSFHSMYVDFSRWSICNFPGYRAIDLKNFLGQQNIKVVCYELVPPENSNSDSNKSLPHYNAYKKYLTSMELTHVSIMTPEEIAASTKELEYVDGELRVSDSGCDPPAGLEDDTASVDSAESRSRSELSDEAIDNERKLSSESVEGFDRTKLGRITSGSFDEDENRECDSEQIDSTTCNEEPLLGALGTGAEYVPANTVVSLISLPPTWEAKPKATENVGDESELNGDGEYFFGDCHVSIGDVGGVAMRKECRDIPIVRFIRATPHSSSSGQSSVYRYPLTTLKRSIVGGVQAGMGMHSSISHRPPASSPLTVPSTPGYESLHNISDGSASVNDQSLLCSGDEVMIQCASSGRYLTVHRGWWVSWTAEDTGSKCVFTINMMSSTGLSYAPKGSRLIAGKPFRLRSVRWPGWEIGCYDSCHAERIGQPVVLYHSRIGSDRSAINHPVKWGKNGKLVSPVCLCVMPEVNVTYLESERAKSPNSMFYTPTSKPKTIANNSAGATPVKMEKNKSETTEDSDTSAPAFFDLQISDEELCSDTLNISIVGWAEVLNRRMNRRQLAYIIHASYYMGDTLKQWTTLRTQEELERIINLIPSEYGGGSYDAPSPSASHHNRSKRRGYYGAVSGSMVPESPQLTSPKKLEMLKRNVNFSTISARHQCSADQSVHLMAQRIQLLLERDAPASTVTSDSPPPPPAPTMSNDSWGDSREAVDESGSQTDEAATKLVPSPSVREAEQSFDNMDGEVGVSCDKDDLSEPTSESSPQISPSNISVKSTEAAESAPVTAEPTDDSVNSICPHDEDAAPSAEIHSKSGEDGGVRPQSPARAVFLNALIKPQILDTWFLHEDAERYLVAPTSRRAPPRQHVAMVARALWDSHWREEIAVLYPSYLAFYPLLAKKASWTLYLQELIGVSHVPDDNSPLPGFSVLKIETIGRVHYIAFSNKETCNLMAASVLEHLTTITFDTSMPSFGDMTDPRDRFVLKSGRWRPAGRRLVLNARKFSFDIDQSSFATVEADSSRTPSPSGDPALNQPNTAQETYWAFSARLLKTVFQLDSSNSIRITPEELKHQRELLTNEFDGGSPTGVSFGTNSDGLFPGREKIISFLDETVRLKLINIQEDIDLNSPEALCFFINIYHTLLIHARLVLSPPSTQDWATFFENVSYEIGGDVFSLAELEHCVIGGRLHRPTTVPRNFCAPPPISDDHYAYALQLADRRVRFIVNCCSISNPPVIYLMKPENMYIHLNEASVALFDYCLQVDMRKRTAILPKICDTYRSDFGSNSQEVLRHILRYLGRENWEKVSILLTGQKQPIVKFQDMKCRSHDSLQLIA